VTGRFLPEKYKPAWLEVSFRFMHYGNALFPHINAGELFVWLGIATGVQKLGLSIADLSVRYLLAGLVVMLISGTVTEKLYALLDARTPRAEAA